MKKMVALLLILLVTLPMASFAEEAQDGWYETPEIVLKYADLYGEGNPMFELGKAFADAIYETTKGRIRIDMYGNQQLGDEKASYQALQMGAVDMFRGNTATMSDFGVEKINLFTVPYIFRNREHLWNVLESELGQQVLEEPQKLGLGMVGLFFMEEGARSFFTTKPVTTVEGFANLKIRVPQTQILMDTVNAIGASATPISYSELYTSLGSGVIDGAENPPVGYLSEHFYEVAPYFILDEHTYNPIIVLMSEISWNKLSAEDQQLFLTVGAEISAKCKEQAQANDDNALKALEELGVTIYPVEDKGPFQEATKSVLDRYATTDELKDFAQAIANK